VKDKEVFVRPESSDCTRFFIIFVILFFFFIAGMHLMGKEVRTEAVEAGHATWKVKSNGSTEFQWITITNSINAFTE